MLPIEEECRERNAALGGPLEVCRARRREGMRAESSLTMRWAVPHQVARVTGSASYARFTGCEAFPRPYNPRNCWLTSPTLFCSNQIRKLYKHSPEVYGQCERISLVSSFLASLLLVCMAGRDRAYPAGCTVAGGPWTPTGGLRAHRSRGRVWNEPVGYYNTRLGLKEPGCHRPRYGGQWVLVYPRASRCGNQ
jgi:hypothetical protein